MHEQARALDVREEVVAEARALARALDQARDVGDHELALVAFERAEHRLERRERIVGDLRRRAREAREQRGLAGVRQADEADVGASSLSCELEPAPPRRRARARRSAAPGGSRSRSACCRARPRRRARPSRAGPGAGGPSAGRRDLLRRRDLRAGRHASTSASPSRRGAASPRRGRRGRASACRRRRNARRSRSESLADEHDVAAAAAVAAVGTALGHVRLAAEAHAAVAARAGLHLDVARSQCITSALLRGQADGRRRRRPSAAPAVCRSRRARGGRREADLPPRARRACRLCRSRRPRPA